MTTRINDYITKELSGWARGHSIVSRLYDKDTGEASEDEYSLTEMRRVAKPGQTWFLDKWHTSKSYKVDMIEITIPLNGE